MAYVAEFRGGNGYKHPSHSVGGVALDRELRVWKFVVFRYIHRSSDVHVDVLAPYIVVWRGAGGKGYAVVTAKALFAALAKSDPTHTPGVCICRWSEAAPKRLTDCAPKLTGK